MTDLAKPLSLALLGATLAGAPLAAQDNPTASADLVGLEGESHGSVTLTQAPLGLLIHVDLTGLPEGVHAIHLHQTGACEPPFDSAGDHFNPADSPHGYFSDGGPHAGDLPNIWVPASGEVEADVFTPLASLRPDHEATLLDDDGSALIVHSDADDYESQPAGAAGDRIACAVISG